MGRVLRWKVQFSTLRVVSDRSLVDARNAVLEHSLLLWCWVR